MFEEVIVGLDGSSLAEDAIPLARSLSRGQVTFLRVVNEATELGDEIEHLRECARQHGAQLRIVVAPEPAAAIAAELARRSSSIAVLATHGRSAWGEAIMGSVALRVLRQALRPVVFYRPRPERWQHGRIEAVAALLDGSSFSERILPHAARAARSLSARLLLLQALPAQQAAGQIGAQPGADILESSYLHRKAAEIQDRHKLDAQWEVLHGEPGPAICNFLEGMPGTLIAMTTHARPPAEKVIMGSVTGYCIRHSGLPLMLYWPADRHG